jgi:hypothetical protein
MMTSSAPTLPNQQATPLPHPLRTEQAAHSAYPAHPGGQPSASTAAGSPAPDATNDAVTAANRTAFSSVVNSPTPTTAPPPGMRPGSGAANNAPPDPSFRFPTEKTKQMAEADRKQPRLCPYCQTVFTPRRTGRLPKYCCGECRVNAFKERQRQREERETP